MRMIGAKEMSEIRPYNEEVTWTSEVEWLFRLMPDDALHRLREVIEYAIEVEEYRRCPISCGGMRCLVQMIDDEVRIRTMEGQGMTYKEAKEVIITERGGREGNAIDEEVDRKEVGCEDDGGTIVDELCEI